MPSFSSRIITKQYLNKVKNEEFWVPKYREVRIAPCPILPTKKEFVKEIFDEIGKHNMSVNLGFGREDGDALVDLKWL